MLFYSILFYSITKTCETALSCKYFHKNVPFGLHSSENFCLFCLNLRKMSTFSSFCETFRKYFPYFRIFSLLICAKMRVCF
jgi:hypothetical protein